MAVTYQSIGSVGITEDTTSINIPKPTGLAEGDGMVACIYARASGAPDITPPAGWTEEILSQTTGITVVQYSKNASAADAAASTFTFSASGTCQMGGAILRITDFGINAGEAGNAESNSTGTDTFTGFTPTRADTLFIFCGGSGRLVDTGSYDINTPSMVTSNPTWTERVELDLNASDISGSHSFAVFTATRPETTATGDFTWTFTDDGGQPKAIAAAVVAYSGKTSGSVTPTTKLNAYALTPVQSVKANAVVEAPTTEISNPIITDWSNPAKPSTTWENPAKPATTWENPAKPSTTWTNTLK